MIDYIVVLIVCTSEKLSQGVRWEKPQGSNIGTSLLDKTIDLS